MPYLATAESDGVGQTYLRVTLKGLQYPASQYNSIVIYCVGVRSYPVASGGGSGTGNYWTTPQTFTGLSAGRSYDFYAEAQYNANGQVVRIPSSGYDTFRTSDPPKPAPSTPYVSNHYTFDLNIHWNIYAYSNTTKLYIQKSWDNSIESINASPGNNVYLTSHSEYGAAYRIRVYAYGDGGTSGWSDWYTAYTGEQPKPETPSLSIYNTNGKTLTIRVSTGSGTEGIDFEYPDGSQSSFSASSNSYKDVSVTLENFGTDYYVRSRAYSFSGYSGWTGYLRLRVNDTTAPTISITNATGNNQILLDWVASDNDGLRETNPFVVYIGSAGGNFNDLGLKGYTSSSSYTISTDRNGNPLSPNVTYPIRVGVYDKSGNYGYADRYVKVTRTRPNNFSWSLPKNSRGDANLTMNEWNDLLERINAFRYYKGLAHATFTTAQRGQSLTATQFNEAANIIDTLSPTTSVPARVATGQDIQAAQLNRLRDSLNSVA